MIENRQHAMRRASHLALQLLALLGMFDGRRVCDLGEFDPVDLLTVLLL